MKTRTRRKIKKDSRWFTTLFYSRLGFESTPWQRARFALMTLSWDCNPCLLVYGMLSASCVFIENAVLCVAIIRTPGNYRIKDLCLGACGVSTISEQILNNNSDLKRKPSGGVSSDTCWRVGYNNFEQEFDIKFLNLSNSKIHFWMLECTCLYLEGKILAASRVFPDSSQ